MLEDILTPRELEIAKLLAAGVGTTEAAEKLGISSKTADTHRLHIMKKSGCKNAVLLALRAVREGLVQP